MRKIQAIHFFSVLLAAGECSLRACLCRSGFPERRIQEIAYLLSTWGNVYDAAIAGAEIIAGAYAHKTNYSRSIGDLSISESYATSAGEFRALAASLRLQKADLFPPAVKVNAQALKNTADRTQSTYTTDFRTGLHDYTV